MIVHASQSSITRSLCSLFHFALVFVVVVVASVTSVARSGKLEFNYEFKTHPLTTRVESVCFRNF